MGLSCSHGAWSGAYSAFHRWRCKLAEVAGLPPLDLMDGFYDPTRLTVDVRRVMSGLLGQLPIQWECFKPSPLHELLHHSDCEGTIPADRCGPIADALEELLPMLPHGDAGGHIGNWKDKTETFIAGLRSAADAGESLEFD